MPICESRPVELPPRDCNMYNCSSDKHNAPMEFDNPDAVFTQF